MLVRVTVDPEPIPGTLCGRKKYSLRGNFVPSVLPLVCFWEEMRAQRKPTWKSIPHIQLRTKADILDVWGNSIVSYATMLPINFVATLTLNLLFKKWTQSLSYITQSYLCPSMNGSILSVIGKHKVKCVLFCFYLIKVLHSLVTTVISITKQLEVHITCYNHSLSSLYQCHHHTGIRNMSVPVN